jgi:putative transposase
MAGLSGRSRSGEELGARVSVLAYDRTYGARVWHDLLADGVTCGLRRVQRLMSLQGFGPVRTVAGTFLRLRI